MNGRSEAFIRRKSARRESVHIPKGTGETVEQAVENAKLNILAWESAQKAKRRYDARLDFFVPAVAEFEEALDVVQPKDAHLLMLQAHDLAGDEGLTAGELAQAAGYRGYEAANLHYGKLGALMSDALEVSPPAAQVRQGHVATGILATPGSDSETETGHFIWVMHPELRAALKTYAPLAKGAQDG